MSMPLFFDFTVDKQKNMINIKREFAAERPTVWDCYTKSEILDKWWMPLPWKSRTKSMDFSEGGKWHYAAVGPNGEEHWSITAYTKIEPLKLFLANDAFGDADGNINPSMPQSKWTMNFSDMGKKHPCAWHHAIPWPCTTRTNHSNGIQRRSYFGYGKPGFVISKAIRSIQST